MYSWYLFFFEGLVDLASKNAVFQVSLKTRIKGIRFPKAN